MTLKTGQRFSELSVNYPGYRIYVHHQCCSVLFLPIAVGSAVRGAEVMEGGNGGVATSARPTVLVTNDDGIDAPGLRFLVDFLVATDLYRVLVCAPDRERSACSHSFIWHRPLAAKKVEIKGAIAYAVTGTPADCAFLGISQALFPGAMPDLVISGINLGSNAGYNVVYSGTVAGAREAFLHGVPSVALSYNWLAGKSNIDDLRLAAEVCIPILNALVKECRNGTYPKGAFLNVDVPADVLHHKGYKITRQAITTLNVGWTQTTPDGTVEQTYVAAEPVQSAIKANATDASSDLEGILWFKRHIQKNQRSQQRVHEEDEDFRALCEGYITITPLCGLSNAGLESRSYFMDWVHRVSSL